MRMPALREPLTEKIRRATMAPRIWSEASCPNDRDHRPGEHPYPYGQMLPIVPPEHPPITEMDYRNVEPLPLFKIRPPKGAPNAAVVLMDQSCYADPEMFGGRIRTPTLERLAQNGLAYPNFQVNAACSPTRTALLTGGMP